jgi:hypothetical protein
MGAWRINDKRTTELAIYIETPSSVAPVVVPQ